MPGDTGIWTRVPAETPCGKDVYVTEMSTLEGSGYPDPIDGRAMYGLKLERCGYGDEAYFIAVSPRSGSLLHIFND